MSEAERRKWDERYAAGSYSARTHPSALLQTWVDRVEPGRALDVACGRGRNSLFLAGRGFSVDAVDLSGKALSRLAETAAERAFDIRTIERDLDAGLQEIARGPYALIVLVRYVNLPVMKALGDRLEPAGLIVCEQHLATSEAVVGPSNPAFRLQPRALAEAAQGLEVLYYNEGIVTDPDGRPAALAQLVARRAARNGPARP